MQDMFFCFTYIDEPKYASKYFLSDCMVALFSPHYTYDYIHASRITDKVVWCVEMIQHDLMS